MKGYTFLTAHASFQVKRFKLSSELDSVSIGGTLHLFFRAKVSTISFIAKIKTLFQNTL